MPINLTNKIIMEDNSKKIYQQNLEYEEAKKQLFMKEILIISTFADEMEKKDIRLLVEVNSYGINNLKKFQFRLESKKFSETNIVNVLCNPESYEITKKEFEEKYGPALSILINIPEREYACYLVEQSHIINTKNQEWIKLICDYLHQNQMYYYIMKSLLEDELAQNQCLKTTIKI